MRHSIVAAALVLAFTPAAVAQVPDDDSSSATMRPVIRGRQAAVTSMKPEATEAARRILQAGGNAFDAAVAGQGCGRRPSSVSISVTPSFREWERSSR